MEASTSSPPPLPPRPPPKPQKSPVSKPTVVELAETAESVEINPDISSPSKTSKLLEPQSIEAIEKTNISQDAVEINPSIPCSIVDTSTDSSERVKSDKNLKETKIVRQGELVKINRDGQGSVYHFTLTDESLSYTEPANVGNLAKLRTIQVSALMAMPAQADFVGTEIVRVATFRLLSKAKSFYLRASIAADAEAWLQDINRIASEAQMVEHGKLHTEDEMSPILVSKADTPNCQLCGKSFGFFSRRHHCRNCGKCVCDNCSREKMRIPRIDPYNLLKVCHECAAELTSQRKYGVASLDDEDEES